MGKYTININRDISLIELLMQFNSIDNNYDMNEHNIIIVDFTYCQYISPSSLVVLTSYLKNKKLTSLNLEIEVKPNLNIDTYITRVDFYNMLDIDKTESFFRHNEEGRFTTIKNITERNYSIAEKIMEILVTHNCVSDAIYYTMEWSFNELLDNIFEHALSGTGGFLIAQSYSDRVEFCIVDNGIGIDNSLKGNEKYSILGNLDCIIKATEKEVTVGTGQGNGLYITRRFIERNKGEMHIYSNDLKLSIVDGTMRAKTRKQRWNGTIIKIIVNKNVPIDIYDVFDTNNIQILPIGYIDNESGTSLW